MTKMQAKVAVGLEDIAVAETSLSHVDGAGGRLILAGADVEDLARTTSFEAVAARMWAGFGGDPSAEAVRDAVGRARVAAHARLARMSDALDSSNAMDALRAATARLEEAPPAGSEAGWLPAAQLTGAIGVFAAAWDRRRRSEPLVAPDPSLGHAADYLRMLSGTPASAPRVRALDAYFVTVVDHGLNASTFAARVVASTRSDMVSAVTAAIGALKGPLHGGAPGPVLDMLDAVGVAERAPEWVRAELAAGRRIMGMGHRVYRTRDPRAAVLEAQLARLRDAIATEGGREAERVSIRLALARAVEEAATASLAARHPERALRANVEFYTAVLLEAVGIPRDLFSATFAASRVVGWTAHVDEERRKGRLIRPSSVYVGRWPQAAPQR